MFLGGEGWDTTKVTGLMPNILVEDASDVIFEILAGKGSWLSM